MRAPGAVHGPVRRDPVARRGLRERSLALSLSVALHLLVLALLLVASADDPRPVAVPPASIVASLVTLSAAPVGNPSPPEAAAVVAEPVAPPEPKPLPKPTLKPTPKPSPTLRPQPQVAQAPSAEPSPEAPTQAVTAQATSSTAAASAAGAISAAPTGPVMVQFPYAYLARMSRTIVLRLHYPAYSRQFGEQGRAIVRVTLRRDGTILDAVLVRRTGSPHLDAEARNVILRIARFAPVPDSVSPMQAEFVIDQPISFRGS